jgi:uncharacterized protein (TIGR03435 family)
MPVVQLRMPGRFAALSALLGLLVGQPAPPTWKEFSIGPARATRDVRATNIRQGMLNTNSISLKSLIGIAAGVQPVRIAGPDWLDSEHYAVAATLSDESRFRLRTRSPDDPRMVEEFRSLLIQELGRRFRLEFHKEARESRDYTLRPVDGRFVAPRLSTSRETGRVTINNSALSANTTLDARNVTYRTIGNWLQGYLEEPVTADGSLPDGPYDFHLKWKTGDHESLLAALGDQLGLELVRQSDRAEYLIVDRVEKPVSSVAPAPVESHAPVTAAPDSSHKFTPTELRRDLRILRDALEEGHPGIHRFTPKPELDRIFDGVAAQLSRPMTALEFYRALAPAVAALKCGHTALVPSRGIQQRVQAEPLFPVEVAVLGNKVYVARDFSAEGQLAGGELLSINDVPIARILHQMLAVVHGDGDSPTAGPYRLCHRHEFARNVYLIAGLQSPFRVRYNAGGTAADATVEGMTPNSIREAEAARYPSARRAGNATWKIVENGAAGVLKVTSFGGKAEDGLSLQDFFQRVFTETNSRSIGRLILDVRDNGGGEDELGRRLFAYFADQPFRYYRDLIVNQLRFRFLRYVPNPEPLPDNLQEMFKSGVDGKYHFVGHPNWGIQQPASPHFNGKLVVLINGGSFSTTCEFLSTLHHRGGATFVGEETGGGYYGNTSGDSATVVLPNSKLMLPVQLVGYYMAIEGNAQGTRGIRPDRPVETTIDDLLNGRDRAMEVALQVVMEHK